MVALSGGEALNADAYTAMAAALRSAFEASWRNRAALVVLGDRWAKNVFDNLAALAAIAPEPLPRFPGAVVVCGAGPSIEEALPFIRASRARLGVVVCDTASARSCPPASRRISSSASRPRLTTSRTSPASVPAGFPFSRTCPPIPPRSGRRAAPSTSASCG